MPIGLMILSIVVIAVGAISSTLYARRQDVLYGPYIKRDPSNGHAA